LFVSQRCEHLGDGCVRIGRGWLTAEPFGNAIGQLRQRMGGQPVRKLCLFCTVALDVGCLRPVALALERVGGQQHFVALVGFVIAGPVHLDPCDIQRPQAGEHLLPVGVPFAQTGQEDGILDFGGGPLGAILDFFCDGSLLCI